MVRRKTVALSALSPAEAAEEMDRLDDNSHLFMCAHTDAACVVARRPDGRIAIASTGSLPTAQDWLVPEAVPTPTLDEDEAVKFLDLSDAPYIFYRDAATGVGVVIYHRYDGHCGLITSDGATPPTRNVTTTV